MTSAQKPTEALDETSSLLSEKRSAAVRPGTVRPPTTFNAMDEDITEFNLIGTKPKTDKKTGESEKDALGVASEKSDAKGDPLELLPPSESSMEDYNQLQAKLFGLTLAFTVFIFPFVWGFYSLQIALDYSLGACAGVVYLRMLSRNVSALGRNQKKNSSVGRLAVFAGVMIVALRWDQLDVVPVFLGFLTYKAAIIAFVLWTSFLPEKKTA